MFSSLSLYVSVCLFLVVDQTVAMVMLDKATAKETTIKHITVVFVFVLLVLIGALLLSACLQKSRRALNGFDVELGGPELMMLGSKTSCPSVTTSLCSTFLSKSPASSSLFSFGFASFL